ncbi:MAG: heavy metal translocating P-type ATPase [Anaerorhabdus sp.]
MKLEYILEGLDCAHCASEVEEAVNELDVVQEATVDFMSKKLMINTHEKDKHKVQQVIIDLVKKVEPDVVVKEKGESIELFLKGLDCANCAQKIEDQIKKLPNVQEAHVNFMNTTCTAVCDLGQRNNVEKEIERIVKELEPDVEVQKTETKKVEKNDESKSDLIKIGIGTVLFVISLFFEEKGLIAMIFSLSSYIVLGYTVIFRALKNIIRGQIFDENFLMAIATIAAIFLQDYREAAAVMLFYQVGEYFQEKAVRSSRKSISDLMNIRPDIAHIKKGNDVLDVAPESVVIDDVIVVKPGERIPLDGVIITGASSLDTSSLTGESLERDVQEGDEVLSGCVNQRGLLEIKVSKSFGDSTVSKILELVENTSSRKTKSENFITKFSKVYTPTVVILAVALAILLPLLSSGIDYRESIQRAAAFLVISCPCALVISVPLGFFAGIGGLSKNGVLVKGSTVIEGLSKLQLMVFDKTGTITEGKFGVSKIIGSSKALELAAYGESNSTHPIAVSILKEYGESIDGTRISEVEEIAGHGIRAKLDDKNILVGNQKLMSQFEIECPTIGEAGTLVYVAQDQQYIGAIVIEDQIKLDSKNALSKLKNAGIVENIMVTGDRKAVADKIARQVGIDKVYSECLPDQKVDVVESLLPKGKLGFAGDGINDAPVLALADVGIAMGGVGSDAAIEAADVVIMDDKLSKIALAITRSKKTMNIIMQNIVGAIGIKIIILILGALGYAGMWLAIFADVGVSLIAILNSIRLLKKN